MTLTPPPRKKEKKKKKLWKAVLTTSSNNARDSPISCSVFLYGFFIAQTDVTHSVIQCLFLATLLHDFNLISREEQRMKHRSSWLSAVKNSQESDKQLHCWDYFRDENSSNSCLLWPLLRSFFFFLNQKKKEVCFFLRCGLVIYVVRKRSLLPVLWSQSCFDSWSTRRFPLFSLSFSPILHSLNAQTWNAVGRRESEFMSSLIPDRQLCGSYLQEKFTPQRSV